MNLWRSTQSEVTPPLDGPDATLMPHSADVASQCRCFGHEPQGGYVREDEGPSQVAWKCLIVSKRAMDIERMKEVWSFLPRLLHLCNLPVHMRKKKNHVYLLFDQLFQCFEFLSKNFIKIESVTMHYQQCFTSRLSQYF